MKLPDQGRRANGIEECSRGPFQNGACATFTQARRAQQNTHILNRCEGHSYADATTDCKAIAMFSDTDDLKRYVAENYVEVTDSRIDDDHWDFYCSYCKITRGFQVIKRDVSGIWSKRYHPPRHPDNFDQDFDAPLTYLFRCPVCHAFKQWIV
jgi:hypothetical protein